MTDAKILDPDHAPTPFTADEIRRGCPPGRSITIRHTNQDASEENWLTVFVEANEEGALLTNQRVTQSSEPVGEASEFRATWDELQPHASFPADITTIETESLSTPLGTFECLRYTIEEADGTKVLWFAPALPGLPVRTEAKDPTGVA